MTYYIFYYEGLIAKMGFFWEKCKKNSYFFLFLSMIVLGQLFSLRGCLPSVDSTCMTYHVVDFSMGFVSRILPGHIFHSLFPNATQVTATIYESVLLLLVSIASAFFLNRIYKSVPKTDKTICLFLITVFCISNIFFIYFAELGMLDVYWIYLFIAFLFLLTKKGLWVLIPIPFFLMLTVHYSSLLCFIPLMALLLLNEIIEKKNKKDKKYLLIVFSVSIVITACLFLYLVISEKSNLVYDMKSFNRILESRGASYFDYYDAILYKSCDMGGARENLMDFQLIKTPTAFPFVITIINEIARQIHFTFSIYEMFVPIESICTVGLLLAIAPLIFLFYKCYFKLLHDASSRAEKFVYICAILQFPLVLVGATLSADIIRWITHAFTCSFIFFLYLLYKKKEIIYDVLRFEYNGTKKTVVLLYVLFVFTAKFYPYW